MLYEFLTTNRVELVERCRAKVALRAEPAATPDELEHGVPHFLDQLTRTLELEQSDTPEDGSRISGPAGGVTPNSSELSETATMHGRDLSKRGFTVEQVVHDYGDLCQAITGLAVELEAPIDIDEFRTLNRCLDNGIAVAVTEFNYQREQMAADHQAETTNQRLGMFAHELRNLLNNAVLALHLIKSGEVGLTGATASVLDNSLVGLRNLIDRSLTDVRISAGMEPRHVLFSLSNLVAEVKLSANLEARVRECTLIVSPVDEALALDADRDLILSALGNLLQNAFKFSGKNTIVTLKAYAMGDRILIDVEDAGPGLPEGDAEKMFLPFTQGSENKSGLGLGLTIARQAVEANQGSLSARNLPVGGCVFTVNLPRHTLAA